MDMQRALVRSRELWDTTIIPKLMEYIYIPNESPHFDPDWKENGHMDRAVDLFMDWALQSARVHGKLVQKLELPGRTPLIYIELLPTNSFLADKTILLYGHLDKQPPMKGWREGLSPWKPVLEDDKLYGRGGADDGYAMFASLAAVQLLEEQGFSRARIVILIEGSEESGSTDLPAYIETYQDKIGVPDLVICLDSGCGNYDQLWMTTSLRGVVTGDLTVKILTEGVHSGAASGVVPDSFDIATQILKRFDTVPELAFDLPEDREAQAVAVAEVLGDIVYSEFPWVAGAHPGSKRSNVDLLLYKTWEPTLTVIGVEGFPPTLQSSGNVLRPYTTLRCSVRVPPIIDAAVAAEAIKRDFEKLPPYGAEVTFTVIQSMSGWNAPSLAPWLEESVNEASMVCFGKPSMATGEGGTIPFMGMLGAKFPDAQFLITGVLGPHSNAHGPNEFLHIPMGVRLTAAVAKVIYDHANQ